MKAYISVFNNDYIYSADKYVIERDKISNKVLSRKNCFVVLMFGQNFLFPLGRFLFPILPYSVPQNNTCE